MLLLTDVSSLLLFMLKVYNVGNRFRKSGDQAFCREASTTDTRSF